jgi:hypothetical protein
MKKVIFIFAFMLMSGFSFANNNNKKIKTPTKEKTSKIVKDFSIVSYESLDLVTRCRITHNVYNSDGVLAYTRTYVVTLSSGTCQGASNMLAQETRDAYNELFN